MKRSSIIVCVCLGVIASPSLGRDNDNEVATLYRTGVGMPNTHYVIATFDAPHKYEGSRLDYNWTNCQIARELFASQPGVTVQYWCEIGRHK